MVPQVSPSYAKKVVVPVEDKSQPDQVVELTTLPKIAPEPEWCGTFRRGYWSAAGCLCKVALLAFCTYLVLYAVLVGASDLRLMHYNKRVTFTFLEIAWQTFQSTLHTGLGFNSVGIWDNAVRLLVGQKDPATLCNDLPWFGPFTAMLHHR